MHGVMAWYKDMHITYYMYKQTQYMHTHTYTVTYIHTYAHTYTHTLTNSVSIIKQTYTYHLLVYTEAVAHS